MGVCRILAYNVRSIRSLLRLSPRNLLFTNNMFDFVGVTEIQASRESLEKCTELWTKITQVYAHGILVAVQLAIQPIPELAYSSDANPARLNLDS